MAATVKRPDCVDTLIAATILPARSRIGTAIERRPISSSSSTTAKPCTAASHDQAVKLAPVGDCLLRTPADRCAMQEVSKFRLAKTRQQHPAHRGAIGRQPRADMQRHAHDAFAGHAGDIDDVLVRQHRSRAGFLQLRRHHAHMRLGERPQRGAVEPLPGKAEQPWRQRETPAVLRGEAGRHQRQQQATRAGAGQPGCGCHFGQRHAGRMRRQDRHHVEALVQGADEIALLKLIRHSCSGRHRRARD